MNTFSNFDKFKAFIAPNMKYFIIFLYNNVKLAIYPGGNIHVLYHYIEIIDALTKLTSSVQRSCHFITSPSINNDIETLHPVISDILIIHKVFL